MGALSKTTSFDKILSAFKNSTIDDLTEQQKKELERWNTADNLIRTYQDSKTIIGILITKWQISQAQAYRDVSNAKRFFGSINVSDKDYYRNLYAEQLEEYAKIAFSKFDIKSATGALKEAAEIRGLKNGDEARDLYIDLEPCQFILSVTVIQDGDRKISEINLDRLGNTIDIEFEDVTNAVNAVPSVSEGQMKKLLDE